MGLDPVSMMGISAAGGAVGSALSARASAPQAIPVPKPTPLYPGVQESYTNDLMQSGVSGSAFNTLRAASDTGLPTNVGPAFEALKSSMGRGVEEGRANLIEKYGVQGLRFGSDLERGAVDYESQVQKDFASILADYTMKAQEGAANRRVAAAGAGQGAAAELATAFAPTAVVAGGGQSPTGAAISSGASSLQNLIMMRALFPNMFAPSGG